MYECSAVLNVVLTWTISLWHAIESWIMYDGELFRLTQMTIWHIKEGRRSIITLYFINPFVIISITIKHEPCSSYHWINIFRQGQY